MTQSPNNSLEEQKNEEIGREIAQKLANGVDVYKNPDGTFSFDGEQKEGARKVPQCKAW